MIAITLFCLGNELSPAQEAYKGGGFCLFRHDKGNAVGDFYEGFSFVTLWHPHSEQALMKQHSIEGGIRNLVSSETEMDGEIYLCKTIWGPGVFLSTYCNKFNKNK